MSTVQHFAPIGKREARARWDRGERIGVTQDRYPGGLVTAGIHPAEYGWTFDELVERSTDTRRPRSIYWFAPVEPAPVAVVEQAPALDPHNRADLLESIRAEREQVRRDVVEFVKLGARVSNDWSVSVPNWATFAAIMSAESNGNDFEPRTIAASFRELFDMASAVEYGRVGSWILYVTIPAWTHQRNGAHRTGRDEHRKYTDDERRAMAAQVITWARSVGADSVRVEQRHGHGDPVTNATGDQPRRVRIWWD